jgi:Cu-processing system permease protein
MSEGATRLPVLDFGSIAVLARKEVRDARRNRWFALFAIVFALLALAVSWLGLAGLGKLGVAGFGRTAASLLNLVIFVVPLMGLTIGAMSVAHEREQGTLLTLLAQPIATSELLLGKFAGAAAALTAAILFGFGASGLVIGGYAGAAQLSGYLSLLGLTLLLGLANLSIGFLLSVAAPRTATALSVALLLWLGVVLFSDLALMGSAFVLRLSPRTLLWLSLANPVQVFKLAALQALQGNLELLGAAGAVARDSLGDRLMPALTAWLAAWIAWPLGLALWLVRRAAFRRH